MSITNIDNVFAAAATGQSIKIPWGKQTNAVALTAGRWYDTFVLNGAPPAGTFAGTALTSVACNTNTAGAIQIGPNVSPANRIVTATEGVGIVATSCPAWLMLVDILMYYPGIDLNTNLPQTLINSASLPRYTSGSGVQMFLETFGTSGPISFYLHPTNFTYTNNFGTSGRTIPISFYPQPVAETVLCNASALPGQIIHSGTTQYNYGPFLPLSGSDYGVQSVQSVQFTAAGGSACTGTLVLCKPLFTIPLPVAGTPGSQEFVFSFPTTPVIQDGACLSFLLSTGGTVAANTNYVAGINIAWY